MLKDVACSDEPRLAVYRIFKLECAKGPFIGAFLLARKPALLYCRLSGVIVYVRASGLRKLQIELVNLCNYRCPLCRTLLDDHVVRRRMTLTELDQVITPLRRQLENVTLYGTRGEPLLHPDLAKAVVLIKAKTSAAVDISTNGSLLTEDRARALLESRVDRIIFAIDGLSQESYSAYRVGGKLDTVLENLRALTELKRDGGYSTKVILQLIPMLTNEAEISDLPRLAGELGVDQVRLKYSASVSRSKKFRPQHTLNRTVDKESFECPFGTDKLYVDPNGDCYPCCYGEGHQEMLLGNALQTDIREIWNRALATQIRASFHGDANHHSFCLQKCKSRPPRIKQRLPIL